MPSTNNRQPAGGALVIASLIIGTGLILVPHPGEAQSRHRIARTVEADEVPESETVTPVGDLSPEAKSAFREALANEGSILFTAKKTGHRNGTTPMILASITSRARERYTR